MTNLDLLAKIQDYLQPDEFEQLMDYIEAQRHNPPADKFLVSQKYYWEIHKDVAKLEQIREILEKLQ